jgi:chromosome segregation ATPase
MTGDARRGTHLELPVELIEEMKSLDEDMWRVTTEALRVYLGAEGDSVAALRRQADLLDDQIAELNDEMQSVQAERDEKIDQRDRITDRIEQIKADRREYEEILDDIIEALVENPSLNIASQRSELEAAAEIRNDGYISEDEIDQVCADVRTRVSDSAVQIAPYRLRRDTSPHATGDEADDHDPVLRSLQSRRGGADE